jgi:hypothetical protein
MRAVASRTLIEIADWLPLLMLTDVVNCRKPLTLAAVQTEWSGHCLDLVEEAGSGNTDMGSAVGKRRPN